MPALIVAFDKKLLLRNGSKEQRLKEVLAGCLLGLISTALNYGTQQMYGGYGCINCSDDSDVYILFWS